MSFQNADKTSLPMLEHVFFKKYMLYKNKYLKLKNQLGGVFSDEDRVKDKILVYWEIIFDNQQEITKLKAFKDLMKVIVKLDEKFKKSKQTGKLLEQSDVAKYNTIISALRKLHNYRPFRVLKKTIPNGGDPMTIEENEYIDFELLKTIDKSGKYINSKKEAVGPQPSAPSESSAAEVVTAATPLVATRKAQEFWAQRKAAKQQPSAPSESSDATDVTATAAAGQSVNARWVQNYRAKHQPAAMDACPLEVEETKFTDYDELRDKIMTLSDDKIEEVIIKKKLSETPHLFLVSKLTGFRKLVKKAISGQLIAPVILDFKKVSLKLYSPLYNDAVNKLRLFRVDDVYPFNELKMMNPHTGKLYSNVKVPRQRSKLDFASFERDLKEEEEDKDIVYLHFSKKNVVPFPNAGNLLSLLEHSIPLDACSAVEMPLKCMETHWGYLPLVERELIVTHVTDRFGGDHLHEEYRNLRDDYHNYTNKGVTINIRFLINQDLGRVYYLYASSENLSRALIIKKGLAGPIEQYYSSDAKFYRRRNFIDPEAFQHLNKLQEMVKNKFKSGTFGKYKYLRCPDSRCPMHTGFLINRLERNELLQFNDSLFIWQINAYQAQGHSMKRILRHSDQLRLGEVGVIMIKQPCPACNTEICRDCSEPYHYGRPCETDEAVAERALVLKAAIEGGNDTRMCLNCKNVIIRSAGCNYMECNSCGSKMCWVCGKEITDAHQLAPGGGHRYHPECGLWEYETKAIQRRQALEAVPGAAVGEDPAQPAAASPRAAVEEDPAQPAAAGQDQARRP